VQEIRDSAGSGGDLVDSTNLTGGGNLGLITERGLAGEVSTASPSDRLAIDRAPGVGALAAPPKKRRDAATG